MPELDPAEAPRCTRCGHRRAHHYVAINATRDQYLAVRCTFPVPVEMCGCADYQPSDHRLDL